MERPWYDDQAKIAKEVETLKGLNNVIDKRREARRQNDNVRLSWFLVHGRWCLDEYAQVSTVTGEFIPAERLSGLPSVCTREELFDHVKAWDAKHKPNAITNEEYRDPKFDWEKNRDRPSPTSITFSMENTIPPTNVLCPVCGRGWCIANSDDVHVKRMFKVFHLDDLAGMELRGVKKHFKEQYNDAEYFMQDEILIRNDRFIDLSPEEDFPTLKKNEHGWVGKKEKRGRPTINDDYIIQKGDDGHFNVWEYRHKACAMIELFEFTEWQFKKAFADAGYDAIHPVQIQNKYGSSSYNGPWFEVHTPYGVFTVGWRKRVIEITFEHDLVDFREIQKKEELGDSTVAKEYVHAWGWKKATGYLAAVRKLVEEYPVAQGSLRRIPSVWECSDK